MAWELEFEDIFAGDELDRDRWLPHYLPHWSNRRLAAARYRLRGGSLELLVEADQEPWCPEFDDGVRVSSLQTGEFAGPRGSSIGQHRFHPDAAVREEQENVRLYTPRHGRIELRAAASDDPATMVALWMIAYEDEPERSAEICVCEIFGRDVGVRESVIGVGVHPFGDPGIEDDFAVSRFPSTPVSSTSTLWNGARTGSSSSRPETRSRPSASRPPIRCSSCSVSTSSPRSEVAITRSGSPSTTVAATGC